jgi:CubicO group peptidase (beta-lactamase class C family)
VVASVRKSILAMLYGPDVESGRIRIDSTLRDQNIEDVGGLSEEERSATIGDLLSARSGVYHSASNGGDDSQEAPPRGSKPHGTYFLYNNWDFNVLGTIFEQLTGKGIYDEVERRLVAPLQMEDFRRELAKIR